MFFPRDNVWMDTNQSTLEIGDAGAFYSRAGVR